MSRLVNIKSLNSYLYRKLSTAFRIISNSRMTSRLQIQEGKSRNNVAGESSYVDIQQAASSPDFAFQPYSHVSASPRDTEEALQDCCSCYNPQRALTFSLWTLGGIYKLLLCGLSLVRALLAKLYFNSVVKLWNLCSMGKWIIPFHSQQMGKWALN